MRSFDLLYLAAAAGFVLWAIGICGFIGETVIPALARMFRRRYREIINGGEKMTVSKKLTSKSGLTIPKHVRAETGFMPGMAVDIETVADGVLIKKRVPACQFCGSVHDVVKIHGIEMCGQCAAALREELDNVGA